LTKIFHFNDDGIWDAHSGMITSKEQIQQRKEKLAVTQQKQPLSIHYLPIDGCFGYQ
jgi:hypothetical protein